MNKTIWGLAVIMTLLTLVTPIKQKSLAISSKAKTIEYKIGGSSVLYSTKTYNVISPGSSNYERNNNSSNTSSIGYTRLDQRDVIPKESPSLRYDTTAEIIGDSNEQCIQYAKRKSGISRPLGYAGTAKIQGEMGKVGSIGLQKYYGHAVYIEKIEGQKITVTDANWIRGKITRRVLDESELRGYIYN